MIPYSQLQLQDKATILTTERKKVFLLLLCWWCFFTCLFSSVPSLVPCIYSFLFKCLFFSRGEKLSQRIWLELRISANITKWPHMWWVSIFLSLHFPHLFMHNFLLLGYHNNLYLCFLQGLHSASVPGILALDLCPSDTSKVLTGTLFLFRRGSLKLMFLELQSRCLVALINITSFLRWSW